MAAASPRKNTGPGGTKTPTPNLDVSYEWNNGILEAKPLPNAPQVRQYRWFFTLMSCYIQTHPIADLINLETGVSMTVLDAAEPSGKWEVVYKPDIGVVLNNNPAPWGALELRAFEGVCDLIVEEISDSTQAEVRRDTEEKKRGYARAGVKEYFILDPTDRHMRFYLLTWPGRYDEIQPDAAGVIRSQVSARFPIPAHRPARSARPGGPGPRRNLRRLCHSRLLGNSRQARN